MLLTAGTRVGPYEILAVLGAGGMGEVYRARDSRLNRDVAVKVVLPAALDDADRVARFHREAQLLAALNHPNIAHIHGLEDAGGQLALVMELVEGPTLADRLTTGALPLDEALATARQVVEALEAAHASGIIHRDLKPANIKVREDGAVKVLDFGLAKAFGPDAATGHAATASPTISVHATAAGIILGTAAYMSPEQARGRQVDRRADVWAFGAVLYEMLTGRRAFDANDTSDTLALVLTKEPDWSALPASTPVAIRRLLRRCLEKDPKRRIPDIAVARLEIDEALAPAGDAAAVGASHAGVPRAGWRWMVPVGAGVILAAAAAAGTAWVVARPTPTSAPVARFGITLPAAQPIAISFNDRDLALSPDGAHLVYTAGAESQLMVRALDRLDPLPLAGITNARAPFVSPNGQWVGFFDRLDEGLSFGAVLRGALKRVPIGGGPPSVIAAVSGGSRGASWGPDDSIIFATSDTTTGLLRVSARGGEPEVLTRPDKNDDEQDHYFPSLLPGGRAALFTIRRGGSERRVALLDLNTGKWRTLIRSGSQPVYVETGHVVYEDGGALWAVRFDVSAEDVVGDPVPVLERVSWRSASANVAFSRRGMLAYAPSAGAGDARSLVWVDRRGSETPFAAPARQYYQPRLSPDGTRVAMSIAGGQQPLEMWIWDFSLQRLTPLQSRRGSSNGFMVWSRDSRQLIYSSGGLFRRAADGTGSEEQLPTSDLNPETTQRRPVTMSPDGKHLIFERMVPGSSYDLMMLSLDGPPVSNGSDSSRLTPLLDTPSDERNAAISPDGRWMAYESNKTGQFQVYVRPFPNVNDAEHPISTAGGRTPLFGPNGRELFFVSGPALMAAAVELAPTFRAENPMVMFNAPSLILDGRLFGSTGRTYDVSSDGQRFLMLGDDAAAAAQGARPGIIVVQNWTEELKARVPGAR
jgi:serine/threonine-protein kinase